MTVIELSNWRRRMIIGTAGHARLGGDGIARRHAEIVLHVDGGGEPAQILRPREGPVSVERHGQRLTVLREWRLADGDVIVIGDRRIVYRNLTSRPAAGVRKGGIAWVQQ
jgi:hypothetical protein